EPVMDYQLFADAHSDLICGWFPDTTLFFVNTSYCLFFGKSRHELLGSLWVDLVPAEQRDAVVDVYKDLECRPRENRYSHSVLTEDGIRWVEWTDSPFFDASERLIGFQSIGRDITDAKLLEEHLQRSESLLQESQRIAQVGSWEWDFESDRVRWSDEAYRILEVDPDTQAPSYELFLETVHPDDRQNVDQRFQDLFVSGEEYEFEHRLLMGDGRIKHVRVRGLFQKHLATHMSRAVGTIQDITGPVTLREKLELISTAIETAVSGIAIADQNGVLTFVNAAFLALWGEKHAEEALGRLATSFWEDPVKAGHILKRLQRDHLWGGELVARRRDGTSFTVHLAASAVLGEDGTITHFIASFSDLTAQRKIEKELRITSDLFQKLLQTTSEGFWLIGDDGQISDVNEQACRMLGYSKEEMLMMRIPDIDAKETPAETEQHMKDFLRTGYDLFETKHRAKDGTLLDVEIRASSWLSGDQQIIAAFFRDITKQKALEATQRAYELSLKSENIRHALFSRFSHELMTPLHSMIGLADQLSRDSDLSNGHRSTLGIIADGARRLKEVLENMLSMANLQVNSLNRHDQSFELCPMIENLISLYRPRCLAKTLSLQVEIDEHTVPCRMRGEKEKIMTILEKLLDNAVENTDQGTIRLGVKAELPAIVDPMTNNQELTLILEIEDSGVGIEPERLSVLLSFDMIKAAQISREVGVGLFTCLMVAKVIDAKITAVSRLGEGSCFRLCVPVYRDSASEKDESHCRQRIRDLVTVAPEERLEIAEHEVANLPEQLQQQLKEALVDGDMVAFTELLGGARASFPAAISVLRHLAETFNYQRIAQLLKH
ncbi:PAS domain S-box protein, partial [Desulfogranum marinum]|uniref:PAS domain S-box protein n=1 Tax=Desulfogranum marinum TaxID=453220 RepID=UPI0019666C0E